MLMADVALTTEPVHLEPINCLDKRNHQFLLVSNGENQRRNSVYLILEVCSYCGQQQE
jgi:hypothetical protein